MVPMHNQKQTQTIGAYTGRGKEDTQPGPTAGLGDLGCGATRGHPPTPVEVTGYAMLIPSYMA